ncbi:SRPBCC family protein [Candidatus Poriferisodalis sp.]|uniref:SRPBCC family protein n=1 Tax=Candidatus Poriferisodalis sp. TaxID=3101277 RepID=UPI003B023496
MVKYADGPTTSVEVHIDAPPSVVWPLLCDINAPAEFSQEFQGADWDDNGPALGATFRGRNEHKVVGEWRSTCTVTAMDHERSFEWTVGDVDYRAARWRFDLEPEGEGDGSMLRFTAEIGPAPSGLSPAIERMPDREEDIVAKRMGEHNTNMSRTVEGYKQLAEARQARTS